LIQFEGEPSLINDLEVAYKRDERIIRFLTVRLDKYAHEYSERRRNKAKNKETSNA
jgi:small subunit ribosomal protein S6